MILWGLISGFILEKFDLKPGRVRSFLEGTVELTGKLNSLYWEPQLPEVVHSVVRSSAFHRVKMYVLTWL